MGGNFRRTTRMVAGGHTTTTPSSIIYASVVVSTYSVCIGLTIAALDNLKVLGCDIQNAYLTAKCRKNMDGCRSRIWH